MILSKNLDVKSTIKIEVEDHEGVFLEVRNTFKGSEITKVLTAQESSGRYEAQDFCTFLFLKGWEGVQDTEGNDIPVILKNNIITKELFEIIPTSFKEEIYNHFVDTYLLDKEDLKN